MNGKLVCGVGISEKGKFPASVLGRPTKEYALWADMLKRCYDYRYKEKHPTYVECTSSENFKRFQYFASWCNSQTGFGNEGWQLDKDVLGEGNKVYSETTCVFVPRKINQCLVDRMFDRGVYKLGVDYHTKSKKFRATISTHGKRYHIGLYDTEEAAHNAYTAHKITYLRELAETYKGCVDDRVYLALSSRGFPVCVV